MPDSWTLNAKVFRDHTVTLMARIVGATAEPVRQADVAAIEYTIYALDPARPEGRTPVAGHTGVALTVAEVIYDTLQTDDTWSVDATGYNFAHTIPIGGDAAFAEAGTVYLVVYSCTPTTGQPYVGLAARLECV